MVCRELRSSRHTRRETTIGDTKMKIVILGANGRTGKLIVEEALAAGDTVTAVVRSEEKRLATKHDRLNVIVGDPCNPKFLGKVFIGQDAVISTLGGKSPTRSATSIYWKSADAIVEAARNSGLKKVAVTSSALLFPRRGILDKILATLAGNVVRSASRMEETLQDTKLDVIVARCGFLTNGDEREYRAELDSLPKDGSSVSRLCLAKFLLDSIHNPSSGFQVYGLSDPA